MRVPPATKYTLARIGLFLLAAALAWPLPVDLLLRLLIAAVVSSVASWFLLNRWRGEMGATIEKSMAARKAEKEKLRAALAGDDDPNAPSAGDRPALP